MEPKLQEHLANQQISFNFNPPGAPNFGGVWESEIRSVKNALQVIVGKQTTSKVVFQTVLRRKLRHSQILADHFWTLFIRDYLPNLQPRGKWLREVQNLEVGKTVP